MAVQYEQPWLKVKGHFLIGSGDEFLSIFTIKITIYGHASYLDHLARTARV